MKLSEDLEHCILHTMFAGEMDPTELQQGEFSQKGQYCLNAVSFLLKGGAKPPLKPKEVLVAAVEVLGGDKQELMQYVKHIINSGAGQDTKTILGAVRNKLAALRTIQTLSDQLATGEFDLSVAQQQLGDVPSSEGLTVLSDLQGDKLVDSLSGLDIGDDLPQLQTATGGLFGLWVLGGEPALGKSTLALQIALEISQQIPVLYYDFENGPQVILYRLGVVFKTVEEVRKWTQNIYLRDSIRTLPADLKSLNTPTLIVVDSFQSIPTKALSRRQDLDGWLGRFEALKKEGHSVLLVSEINRQQYGKISNQGFKESGEIEYKADTAIKMIGSPDTPEIYLTKNRHGKFKGYVGQLMRINELWFQEISNGEQQEGL